MKRFLRILFASIAIFALLFVNLGPYTIHVFANESGSSVGSAPKWEKPVWKKPEWNKPSSSKPTWEKPEWEKPSWDKPEWDRPDWEKPQWDRPEWEKPEWGKPEWTKPDWEKPEWTQPNWNDPSGNHDPSQNINGNQNPSNDPSNPPQNGTNDPINSENNGSNEQPGGTTNDKADKDSPFINLNLPSFDDTSKHFYKDFIVKPVELLIKDLDGTLTDKDVNKAIRNLYKNGFKLFTKEDPTITGIFDAYDFGMKTKEYFDKAKTFDTYKKIHDLKKAGNIADAARELENLRQAGKAFSTGNAVVSALTMPLTIMDTVNNVNKFKNATTAEAKEDAAWGLVDNTGSLLTGAAPFVAMIPGAQPIAAGMVVVGVTLSGIALGRKLWKNREKIVTDVKQKAKKVKKWFKSIFG